MTTTQLRTAGYASVGQLDRDILVSYGFQPKTQTIGHNGREVWWFPAPIVWLGCGADPEVITQTVLGRIAADPDLEAALFAVWVGGGFTRYSATISYVESALPDLFDR